MRNLENTTFLVLIGAASLAFAWILWPFSGAILRGVVLAIAFAPLQRWLATLMRRRRTLAALVAETIIVGLVVVPLIWIGAALVAEASSVYVRIQSGQLDFGRYFQQVFDALPAWAVRLLDRIGLEDPDAVRERLSGSLLQISQFVAARVVNIGHSTVLFVASCGPSWSARTRECPTTSCCSPRWAASPCSARTVF